MLHHIEPNSSFVYFHCTNPKCEYHNCAAWEAFAKCKHHDTHQYVTVPAEEMKKRMAGTLPAEQLAKLGDTHFVQPVQHRVAGTTRAVPIEHPEIVFTGPGVVALPACDGVELDTGKPCTTRTFLKVDFTEEELQAPNIMIAERDPHNPGMIHKLTQHPAVARHQQLAAALRSQGRDYTPPNVVDAA